MSIELIILAIALAVIFKPKSIHIDFTGKDDNDQEDEPKPPKQIKPRNNRKQLKK